jgi:hypothetical protein
MADSAKIHAEVACKCNENICSLKVKVKEVSIKT